MPSGPCLYNRSNPGNIHVDLSQPFTLHHDLVLVIFWTVYFITLSSPFAVSFVRKLKDMRERISIRRFINRAIIQNGGKRMHMEVLASGRVSFKPRFQVERKYKANVMKIVNDATPPIPLHELEKFGFEMRQRGSVLDLTGKRGPLNSEAIKTSSSTSTSNEKTSLKEGRSSPLSALRKASAKVHPHIPEIRIQSPQSQTEQDDEVCPSGEDQPSDENPSFVFVPIPYGIKLDRSNVEIVIRNGVQGIVVNPAMEESDFDDDQDVTGTKSETHRNADDKAAAIDYSFRQMGRRATIAPQQFEEMKRRRQSYPAHMMGLMTQNLQKYN